MFLSLAQSRRSIRRFKDKPIEAETMDTLIETMLRAPSSMGKNPWEFIIVDGKTELAKLSTAKQFGSTFVENAPLVVVICADPGISDVWIEDASITATYLHLSATSLGLGSCWIQIRERMHSDETTSEAYIADLLKIPDNLGILAMVAIGYPDEEKAPHKKETLQYDKVYAGIHGSRWEPSA